MDRDCGIGCPYAQHAPETTEGAACWLSGMASVKAGMSALEIDMTGALAAAREMGAAGWAVPEMLASFAAGMRAGGEKRQAGTPEDQEGGNVG